MAYNPNDYYFKKAKAENYVARSVYKLQEIDDKYRIIKKGDKVLDLGASPGSWSQYTSEKIGEQGALIGIDITPINFVLPNTHFITSDIYAPDLREKIESIGVIPPFQVVLSDMAPSTTGIRITDQARSYALCEMALWVAKQYLQSGGHFVCKMFDQNESQNFRKELKLQFKKVDILRPKSTRKESKEIFIIGMGFIPLIET